MGFVTNRESLWVQVVRGKYGCGNDLLPKIDMKKPRSRVWSGIKATWEKLATNMETVQGRDGPLVRWKHERHGQFNVSSAYRRISEQEDMRDPLWGKLWKLSIPQRCKTHMWLILQERILTNEDKQRRGLHRDGRCDLCTELKEDTLHVLCDCRDVREIWWNTMHYGEHQRFLEAGVREWIGMNIYSSRRDDCDRWSEIFCILCWLIWKRRNMRIHENIHQNIVSCIAEARAIHACMGKAKSQFRKGRSVVIQDNSNNTGKIMEEGWKFVYVDGAFSHVTGAVGCGGILSNDERKMEEAFSFKMYDGNELTAELWGCCMGLKRAWEKG